MRLILEEINCIRPSSMCVGYVKTTSINMRKVECMLMSKKLMYLCKIHYIDYIS